MENYDGRIFDIPGRAVTGINGRSIYHTNSNKLYPNKNTPYLPATHDFDYGGARLDEAYSTDRYGRQFKKPAKATVSQNDPMEEEGGYLPYRFLENIKYTPDIPQHSISDVRAMVPGHPWEPNARYQGSLIGPSAMAPAVTSMAAPLDPVRKPAPVATAVARVPGPAVVPEAPEPEEPSLISEEEDEPVFVAPEEPKDGAMMIPMVPPTAPIDDLTGMGMVPSVPSVPMPVMPPSLGGSEEEEGEEEVRMTPYPTKAEEAAAMRAAAYQPSVQKYPSMPVISSMGPAPAEEEVMVMEEQGAPVSAIANMDLIDMGIPVAQPSDVPYMPAFGDDIMPSVLEEVAEEVGVPVEEVKKVQEEAVRVFAEAVEEELADDQVPDNVGLMVDTVMTQLDVTKDQAVGVVADVMEEARRVREEVAQAFPADDSAARIAEASGISEEQADDVLAEVVSEVIRAKEQEPDEEAVKLISVRTGVEEEAVRQIILVTANEEQTRQNMAREEHDQSAKVVAVPEAAIRNIARETGLSEEEVRQEMMYAQEAAEEEMRHERHRRRKALKRMGEEEAEEEEGAGAFEGFSGAIRSGPSQMTCPKPVCPKPVCPQVDYNWMRYNFMVVVGLLMFLIILIWVQFKNNKN